MRYIIANYRPTCLFSLRSSAATSSGGTTTLVPTPYAVKMALVDCAYRTKGQTWVQSNFEWLRDLEVVPGLCGAAVINNAFIKVAKIAREISKMEPGPQNRGKYPFLHSVGVRQFVYYDGDLKLALNINKLTEHQAAALRELLICINYFGKRGSFMQFTGFELCDELGPAFAKRLDSSTSIIPRQFVLQHLDDMTESMTLDRVDVTSTKRISLGKHRVILPYMLPLAAGRRGSTYVSFVPVAQ